MDELTHKAFIFAPEGSISTSGGARLIIAALAIAEIVIDLCLWDALTRSAKELVGGKNFGICRQGNMRQYNNLESGRHGSCQWTLSCQIQLVYEGRE